MSISQQKIDEYLGEWRNLDSKSRDKVIHDVLFPELDDNLSPMFSDNVKDSEATEKLVTRLAELGWDIIIENAPRSSLSIVRCNNISVPLMPAHKAIAFIGYCIAVSNGE